MKDASTLSAKGLSILKQHKVIDLIVNGLKITVNDLISCLGDWSIQNLRSLSVAKGSFMDFSRLLQFLTYLYILLLNRIIEAVYIVHNFIPLYIILYLYFVVDNAW